MPIRENIKYVNQLKARAAEKSGRTGEDVLLVAVTKLHDVDEINEAIECGITDIGENKVQEIMNKYDRVKPVRWHLIGHLQTNKVKYIIDKVAMIHSVDSLKLAEEIDKRAAQHAKSVSLKRYSASPLHTAGFPSILYLYRLSHFISSNSLAAKI